jgi:hypothetical protein
MKKLVIMPGGFHPFHAGHLALYQAAERAFPDADVYVAATADTSERPFPFEIKQRIANLAGIPRDRFVQVKSPFRAEEITRRYDADDTALIFVRSEKDANKPPQAGGVRRDGTPAYLQPYTGRDLAPLSQQGYMTYLPTVEFGPGLTSATEIRRSWPGMTEKQKQTLLTKMYPVLQGKPAAVSKIQELFDRIIGHAVQEAWLINDPQQGLLIQPDGGMGTWSEESLRSNLARKFSDMVEMVKSRRYRSLYHVLYEAGVVENMVLALRQLEDFQARQGRRPIARGREIDMSENQGWAATYNEETGQMAGTPASGLRASYQDRENQPIDEDYIDEKWSEKYKRSINCDDPKGFSQRAHCAGRKK